MRTTTKLVVTAVIVALLGLAGWAGWRQVAAKRGRKPAPAQTAIPVSVATVAEAELESVVNVTGTVEPDRKVTLASQIPGKVTAVTVDEGDRVRAGQVVVRLEDDDVRAQAAQARAAVQAAQAAREMARTRLEQALAGARPQERAQAEQVVRQAQAALDNAHAELRRAEDLFDSGAISEQQLELTRTQRKVAEAQYQTAREQLDLVREGARREDIEAARAQVAQAQAGMAQAQAALQAAQVTLAKAVMHSPLDGAVSARMVDPGQSILPGMELLEVVDNRQVYVKATVSESEVRAVRRGQPVRVQVDAYPDESFAGVVSDLLPAAREETRMFQVRVGVPNPQGRLKAGMFARGAVVTARLRALALPRRAVVVEGARRLAFVVEGGKAHVTALDLGIEHGDLVQVTSGLGAGAQVVISGQDRLRDGDAVKVGGGG